MKTASRSLHIAWLRARYGGAHKYLDRLVRRLGGEGYETAIFANQQELERPFLDALAERGTRVITGDIGADPRAAAGQLAQLISDFRPDIVHFNSSSRKIRELADCSDLWDSDSLPSLFTMHAPLVWDGQSRDARFRNLVSRLSGRKKLAAKARFAKRFNRIISVSERFAVSNQRCLRLQPAQVVAVANGVDTKRFRPPVRPATADERETLVIGGCGSLVTPKRFDLLIQAFAQLGMGRVELRIAGDGPQRTALERLIARLDLMDRVRLAGHQSDVREFYAGLDLFVMSSDYEAFPYSQLEAMATGLPSVVTDVGDLPLMVRDGKEGLVVPAGNVPALAAALDRLLKDRAKRLSLGQAARERAVTHYDQDRCEQQTLDLFDSLLAAAH